MSPFSLTKEQLLWSAMCSRLDIPSTSSFEEVAVALDEYLEKIEEDAKESYAYPDTGY